MTVSTAAPALIEQHDRRPPARRLLLISYHFPPGGAAGALRWEKLAPLAAERGWLLDVITLDPAHLDGRRDGGASALPAGTRVFHVPAVTLKRERIVTTLLATLRALRSRAAADHEAGESIAPAAPPREPSRPGLASRTYGALCETATQRRWALRAAALALRLASRERYAAVITCGPPHMVHVAGRRVAERHALPLVLDLRDPWRLVERLADSIDSPVWRWQAAWHERGVVPRADLIVMNTVPARDAMRERYPERASRIIAVMNGFDEDQPAASERGHKFVVTYTGSIYLDRDPGPLFEAAKRLIERRRLAPRDFGITLVGSVQRGRSGSTIEIARRAGIEDFVELLPHRPRGALREILARSAVLVSLAQDSHLAIPSKIFEYMQFDAWILAMAEPHNAAARLLEGSQADVVHPDDAGRIAERLEQHYDQYRRGEYPVRLATERRFSRRAQADILFDALERCIAAPVTVH